MTKPTIVVIGAGVIGLTSALSLQESLGSQFQVLVVSRDFPTSTPASSASSHHDIAYASMWAGAHVRPIPVSSSILKQQASWLKTTAARLRKQLQETPWIGISAVRGVEYLENPTEAYANWGPTFAEETGLANYEKLTSLPPDVQLGFAYDTFCVNAPLYCTGLLRTFVLQGGKTLRKHLASEWEAFSVASRVVAVVNASGSGFGDPASFPTRGQIVLTNLDFDQTITRQNSDGSWSFVIPRSFNGGTIIGGTKEPSEWDAAPKIETRQKLLEAAKKLDHVLAEKLASKDFAVLADVVGRRPTRQGDVRLEVEVQPSTGKKVVHAYGAGGRGYELSWGIAGDVARLVGQVTESSLKGKL